MHAAHFLLLAVFSALAVLPVRAAHPVARVIMAPDITINYRLSDSYFLNMKTESFHRVMQYDQDDSPLWKHSYTGTDIQLFVTRRLSPFHRLALGYQYGYKPDEKASHRIIQQFSLLRRPGNLVLAHRFRTDQTFHHEDPLRIRLRYRISTEIPLQGQSLDPREFFLVLSDELLLSAQDRSYSAENRAVINLGYAFLAGQKIQAGIDYRLSRRSDSFSGNLLVKVSAILNF